MTHLLRPIRIMVATVVLLAAGVAAAKNCRDVKPVSWDIEVGPPGEPGERLMVTGHVISDRDRMPLAGMTVYAYHADAKGDYGYDKKGPRLCGILITNARGEYRIRTSMPGGYGGSPAHIHFEIWGPRVTHHHAFVNLVPGQAAIDTSRAVAQARERAAWSSGFGWQSNLAATDRPVFKGQDGILRCTRDLVVSAPR